MVRAVSGRCPLVRKVPPLTVAKLAIPAVAVILLAGCSRTGEIDATGGVGITALRSPCPHVAIPAGTGDITLFNPANSRDASAIDIEATMTNVTATCDDAAEQVGTSIGFDVLATRRHAEGARDVTLPYFVTMLQGGTAVTAKRVGHIVLHFDAGQVRAQAHGTGTTTVSRAAATLPADVRERLTKKRKAGEQDAATDPLSDPAIRQSVAQATFEALVGFQLTEDQLKYNATR
jgi:hypothetical protein